MAGVPSDWLDSSASEILWFNLVSIHSLAKIFKTRHTDALARLCLKFKQARSPRQLSSDWAGTMLPERMPQHRPKDSRRQSRYLSRKHQARALQELRLEAG